LTRSYRGMNIYKEFAAKPTKLMDFYVGTSISVLSMLSTDNCYNTMVCPIVEYASTIWAPHTLSNTNHLESIQRRAVRFCYNDFVTMIYILCMVTYLYLCIIY